MHQGWRLSCFKTGMNECGRNGWQKAHEIQIKQNKDHKSLATSITQERIKVLNKKSKYKIKFEIIDLKNDEGVAAGTTVVFSIPF